MHRNTYKSFLIFKVQIGFYSSAFSLTQPDHFFLLYWDGKKLSQYKRKKWSGYARLQYLSFNNSIKYYSEAEAQPSFKCVATHSPTHVYCLVVLLQLVPQSSLAGIQDEQCYYKATPIQFIDGKSHINKWNNIKLSYPMVIMYALYVTCY